VWIVLVLWEIFLYDNVCVELVMCSSPYCSWAITAISFRGPLFPCHYGWCGSSPHMPPPLPTHTHWWWRHCMSPKHCLLSIIAAADSQEKFSKFFCPRSFEVYMILSKSVSSTFWPKKKNEAKIRHSSNISKYRGLNTR
jgi:hypothetical protein